MQIDAHSLFESEFHFRRLRNKLILYLDRRCCPSSEDLADEALARLFRRTAKSNDPNAEALAFGIVKKVYLEWGRRNAGLTDLRDDAPADEPSPAIRRFRLIAESSVGQLSPGDREFLETYFVDRVRAKELAARMGTTPIAVRMRAFRLRRRLAGIVAQMLAASPTASPLSRSAAA